MDFTFIHAADIHLGSPLGGLDLHDDAPVEEIRNAPRRAFENLIDYCCAEKIALLLIAGDLFDGRADLETQLFVEKQLRRLDDAGTRCVLLRGNHDAASKQVLQLRLPESAHELSVKKAEAFAIPELGVVVHGRGFENQHVPDPIVEEYEPAVHGMFNIGVLHTSAEGLSRHPVYAPCTLDQLTHKGYQYWALGHIHKRRVLCEDPPVVFCGNLQGRHPAEIGAKGASIIHVSDGVIVDGPAHFNFDVLRWHTVECDIEEDCDEDALLGELGRRIRTVIDSGDADMTHVVRVEFIGRTVLHRDLVDSQATWNEKFKQVVAEAGQDRVWVERIRVNTSPPLPPIETLREREDMVGDLAKELAAFSKAEASPDTFITALDALKAKIPDELLEGDDALEIPVLNPNVAIDGVLAGIENDLLSRLVEAEATTHVEAI